MPKLPGIVRSSTTICVAGALAVFAAIAALRGAGALEGLELDAYDLAMRLRPAVEPDRRIVVIAETEADLQRYGHPLSDALFAEAIEHMADGGARAIGIDKYRDIPVPPGSETLDRALQGTPNLFWVMQFGSPYQASIAPPAALAGTERVGFNDLIDDADGTVRRGLLFLDDGQNFGYAFALRLAMQYLAADQIVPQADPDHPQYLRLGQTTFVPFEPNDGGYVGADAAGYQFLLDYAGQPAHLTTYTLGQLLDGQLPDGALHDKVVLLGAMAESLKDYFYTPYSRGQGPGQRTYGVELHGLIVSQLLRAALQGARPMQVFADRWELMWTLAWALLGALAGRWLSRALVLVAAIAAGLLVQAGGAYAAFVAGWWVPVVPPALGWLLAAALALAYMTQFQRRERKLLMQLFSKQVSPQVADLIWTQRDEVLDGGRLRPRELTVTVLFTDMKGFTPICERLTPPEVMDWLNDYMDVMTQVVIDNNGVVDDYAGDAIKADFGVPLPRTSEAEIQQDAINAVRCAQGMAAQLRKVNEACDARGLPRIQMRIGINTGPAVVGTLGSAERMKYTSIGDTVNVAARLESWEKDYNNPELSSGDCRIIIGERTMRYVQHACRLKPVGAVPLKGKSEKVNIYQVAEAAHASPEAAVDRDTPVATAPAP